MTIFELMLDENFRRQFIEKKKLSFGICSNEIEKMRAYILSEECTEHIQMLMRGDYFFNIPRLMMKKKQIQINYAVFIVLKKKRFFL